MNPNNQHKKTQLKKKKGAALAMVVLLLLLLSITIVTFWGISLTENRTEIYQNKRTQAYYLAWSGANSVASWIIDNPLSSDSLKGNSATNTDSFSNGDVEVTVEEEAETKHLLVHASGTVRGVSNEATIRLHQLSGQELLDRAIYSNSDLDISGMEVNGDIQSGGLIATTTNPNASNYFSGISYPNDPRTYQIKPFPQKSTPDALDIYLKNTTSSLSQDDYSVDFIYISDITIDKGVLNLIPTKTKENPMKLMVDTMSVDGTLGIDASKGRVELYVKERLEMKGPQSIINYSNPPSPSNLIIYLAPGSVFDVQAGLQIDAYIIGPEATMYYQSNYTMTNGALITNVILKNANNGPNGIVNHVPPEDDLDVDDILIAYDLVQYE